MTKDGRKRTKTRRLGNKSVQEDDDDKTVKTFKELVQCYPMLYFIHKVNKRLDNSAMKLLHF